MNLRSRLQDSSTWILDSPESLVILMLMGTGIASLFFSVFLVFMGINHNWVLMVLFGVFCYSSLRQFIKTVKMIKATSLKEAFNGITAREFVWKRNKYGNKIDGGVKDGDGRYKSNESSYEQNADGNGAFGQEIRDIYCKPK